MASHWAVREARALQKTLDRICEHIEWPVVLRVFAGSHTASVTVLLLLQGRQPRPQGQRCDSQHPGGREPGSCGKVNPGEALINVVIKAKRKMLNRLDQKGT
jgi:hypothetical protein